MVPATALPDALGVPGEASMTEPSFRDITQMLIDWSNETMRR
jgi:hypothetical protein